MKPPDTMLLGITSGGSVRWRFSEGLDTYVTATVAECGRRVKYSSRYFNQEVVEQAFGSKGGAYLLV